MKNYKRLTIMLLILAIVFTAVPVRTEAAAKVPAKVWTAVENCVNENGRCIVIDQARGKMYLFKQDCRSGQWELKKSFRCIVADTMCRNKHYLLMRNNSIDQYAWGTENRRWSYGVHIDCYEKAYTNMIHSYTEILTKKGWKTMKSSAWNDFGIGICEKNARYIWKHYCDGTALMVC